jgi:hypothetical protein
MNAHYKEQYLERKKALKLVCAEIHKNTSAPSRHTVD